MTTRLLIATALLTSLLGGCTIQYHNTQPCLPCSNSGSGNPLEPMVRISDGNISVDQDVLRFRKDQTNVTITWRVPEGYSFPANGVVFERAAAQEIVECQRGKSPREFTCRNLHSRPGVYRYGINVNQGETPLKPLDPYLWNE